MDKYLGRYELTPSTSIVELDVHCRPVYVASAMYLVAQCRKLFHMVTIYSDAKVVSPSLIFGFVFISQKGVRVYNLHYKIDFE